MPRAGAGGADFYGLDHIKTTIKAPNGLGARTGFRRTPRTPGAPAASAAAEIFSAGVSIRARRTRLGHEGSKGRGQRSVGTDEGMTGMKQYLLSIYQPDAPPPPEVMARMDQIMANVDALVREAREAGAWVFKMPDGPGPNPIPEPYYHCGGILANIVGLDLQVPGWGAIGADQAGFDQNWNPVGRGAC